MSESEPKQVAPSMPEAATLADFLAGVPPGVQTRIPGAGRLERCDPVCDGASAANTALRVRPMRRDTRV